jgi:hypothetical protein
MTGVLKALRRDRRLVRRLACRVGRDEIGTE